MHLPESFFLREASLVAPDLLGKRIVRQFDDGSQFSCLITETEAYCGQEDLACHASKGRTPRTDVMFRTGGKVYVYFIYGKYWLFNIVTGFEEDGSAVLIRGVSGITGPGRVGQALQLDRSFYGEELHRSSRIWVEDGIPPKKISALPRVGIDYAPEPWRSVPWRFVYKQ